MKGKTLYWVAGLILFFGMLLSLPLPATRVVKGWVRDALAPYQALTTGVGQGLQRRVERWRRRGEMAVRLAAMEQELSELRRDLLLLADVREQNDALRRQLGYVERMPERLIACRVISRGEMTGWWRTVRLNRGRAAGLEPDMAVVAEHGLVGRVLETSRYTAEVLLISDASSHVSVRLLPSGTIGILEGVGSRFHRHDLPELLLPVSAFRVEYLAIDSDIRENDSLVTSGLGGVFPPGLPVGRVTAVQTDDSGLYRRATIRPTADLARLDTVYAVVARREVMP